VLARLALVTALLLPLPALAQSVPPLANVVATCGTPNSTYNVNENRPVTQDQTGKLCGPGSGGTTVPVTPGAQTVTGFQVISSTTLASATAPTVPATTTHMDIYTEGTAGTNNQCLRYRDDGSAPTGSTGAGLAPQQDILGWSGSLTNVQFINATGGSCTLTLRYWK